MPKESSPFVSPDTLRKTTQMMKHHFDSYTKRNYGYDDIRGSHYTGTVENFGSELFLESRKMLMDKPSLKNILIRNTFDFYFDIRYSNLISTYDQQYMLTALLRKDVLLSNCHYHIRFDNCEDVYILRSESWSDDIVGKDHFVHTTTNPTLVIVDQDDVTTEIPLIISDGSDHDTDYYFFMNNTTVDLINSYEDNTLTTIDITDKMYELPFVWICVYKFKLLPPVVLTNNIDYNNKPLLTPGTDGHNVSHLYPKISSVNNVPSNDSTLTGDWYLKITPTIDDGFSLSNIENNYTVSIEKITYLNSVDITSEPLYSIDIINSKLNQSKITLSSDVEWFFRQPRSGDYDYNTTTYINRIYAYIKLDVFDNNASLITGLLPAFNIIYDNNYEHSYEELDSEAVSGIHIDSSSDYTDNGIPESNGVVHSLCEFDGLPSYYEYMSDHSIHRSHVEMYSIHDKPNMYNQSAVDKYTAVIIVDSGIPQNDLIDVYDALNVVIKYDPITHRYKTYGESISPMNTLSEITHSGNNTFGNSNMSKYANNKKFVYHGNGIFSLSMIELDPELERGRVYIISNDDCSYKNNDNTNFVKSARTFARICDIPTSFVQLTNVSGTSPTIVIDKYYTRTESCLTTNDLSLLINDRSDRIFRGENHDTLVFSYEDSINDLFTLYGNDYHVIEHLNESINLSTPSISTDYTFEILNGGSGYNVDDTFTLIIGGIYFSGVVDTVDEGVVTSFTLEDNIDAIEVNIGNISSKISTYSTTTLSGSGNNLSLTLTIDDDKWNSLQRTVSDEYYNGLYAFKFDIFGNIWIWEYDNLSNNWYESLQLTGTPIINNKYDSVDTMHNRSNLDVFINNILRREVFANEYCWRYPLTSEASLVISEIDSDIPKTVDIMSDLSNQIIGKNIQNTYYVLEESDDYENTHALFEFSLGSALTFTNQSSCHKYVIPKFHELNLHQYYNRACEISYTQSVSLNTYNIQPSLCIYDPYKDKVQRFSTISTDRLSLIDEHEMTFRDVLIDHIDYDGILNYNVYKYNEYDTSQSLNEFKEALSTYNHSQLIDYIHDNFINSYPLKLEGTEYAFTNQMLIDYIIQNHYESPVYKKNDISLLHSRGEKVVDYIDSKYVGLGEQPKGGYTVISSEIHNPNVKINNNHTTSELLYVFRIPDDSNINDLSNYRMKDNEGNDISELSLLIYNETFYVFSNNTWISINRR